MIEAFHSNWTKPFLINNNKKDYKLEDFEILTTILSALKWRQKNGSIKMITDEIGAEYYERLNISSIWDLGVDATLDKQIDKDINPSVFWAAGKIYSLSKVKTPIISIDTDFILWDEVSKKVQNKDFYCVHREDISDKTYPNKDYFNMKKDYRFNEKWDFSILPCNTAFLYLNNEKLKNYYMDSSISFMKNVVITKESDRIKNMLFAEQRMISICAKYMDIPINALSTIEDLFNEKQKSYTHIWGYKDILRQDYEKRSIFCKTCISRIKSDFPEFKDKLENIDELNKYMY